ncbi:MAG: AbrB/MazE/SpoVT family DNA-binding domain-containing protein [Patescibacteria group bacterium]|mgnify:FL=1
MKSKHRIVSITSQGQLTVPKAILREFGVTTSVKAIVSKNGKRIIVTPKADFWSLQGVLKGKVKLSDPQLRKARKAFAKHWPRYAKKRS